MGIVAIGRIENIVVALVFLVETWIGDHRGDREEERQEKEEEDEHAEPQASSGSDEMSLLRQEDQRKQQAAASGNGECLCFRSLQPCLARESLAYIAARSHIPSSVSERRGVLERP